MFSYLRSGFPSLTIIFMFAPPSVALFPLHAPDYTNSFALLPPHWRSSCTRESCLRCLPPPVLPRRQQEQQRGYRGTRSSPDMHRSRASSLLCGQLTAADAMHEVMSCVINYQDDIMETLSSSDVLKSDEVHTSTAHLVFAVV
ncbi:hypothetical protein NQD34_007879 [Periophthalmus magnuspinnatus]|nr:hypothetical protein NQD34_007879 [Periophthalmus magnuspinnatus]